MLETIALDVVVQLLTARIQLRPAEPQPQPTDKVDVDATKNSDSQGE